MSRINYDIRVARLIKSTESNSLQKYLSYKEKHTGTLVCLGHFDIIVIDKLTVGDGETPLLTVQEDSQRMWSYFSANNTDIASSYMQAIENNYTYPLYAIKQLNTESDEETPAATLKSQDIEAFWNFTTNYTVVTRLHCEREKGTGTEPFSTILANRLKSQYQVNDESKLGYVYLPATEESKCAVNIAFYDSLELGDVVGFIKCDSLGEILKVQRCLYETPCVSDAYTYCGINAELFQNGQKPNSEELLVNKKLEYLSTRFSVKQAKYAEMIYPVLLEEDYTTSDRHFFVTGNVDAVIDWRNCSEAFLIDLIGKLIQIDKYVSGHESMGIMYQAFNDIITRVGLKHNPPSNSREFDFKKENVYIAVDCPDELKRIVSDPQKYSRWKYPLIKLLGTLQTMSKNCVMDDLSRLIIPGVNAILKRVAYLIQNGKRIDETELLSFFGNCTSLANDILHLENQLVQHPELMPVRYFIPAIVLGFEQKFISECAYCIEKLDKSQDLGNGIPKRFQPIIFPSYEENTSTQCYLDHIGDKDYVDDTALGIFVPVHELYQPWKILHILCHEVAHYCGDDLRDRDYRLGCIINTAAEYILLLWDAYLNINFSLDKIDVINDVRRKLATKIRELYDQKGGEEKKYLAEIQRYLPVCTVNVASNREWQEEYQNSFVSSLCVMEQLAYITRLDTMNSMFGGSSLNEVFKIHLQCCLLSHYKECYADIMMILLLGCKFNEYYECVYSEECLRLLKAKDSMPRKNYEELCEFHSDRLAFVCITIEKLKNYSNWTNTKSDLKEHPSAMWADIAIKKASEWRNNNGSSPKWYRAFLPEENSDPYKMCGYESEQLLAYLERCALIIEDKANNCNEISRLRTILSSLETEQFDWNYIRGYLEKGELVFQG